LSRVDKNLRGTVTPKRAHLDIPSPHDGEGGQGEGISKERDNSMDEPLSQLVPRRERDHFSEGGFIKMRHAKVGVRMPACIVAL